MILQVYVSQSIIALLGQEAKDSPDSLVVSGHDQRLNVRAVSNI